MANFLTALKNRINEAFERRFIAVLESRQDKEPVIFAGISEPTQYSKPGEVEFGIYVKVDPHQAVWLPAVASQPDVVGKLQAMKLGEQFRITAERSEGGMGTRVDAIKQNAKWPVISLAEKSPGLLWL